MVEIGWHSYTPTDRPIHVMANKRWQVSVVKYIAPVITITLVTLAAIALLDRRPVVEAMSIRFNVGQRFNVAQLPTPILAGDKVTIQWVVKELRHGCGGRIYPMWIDSEGGVYGAQDAPDPVPIRYSDVETPQTFYRPRMVPPELKPGPATFAPRAERWCPTGNFLQQYLWPIRDKLPEVKFTVAPRP